MVFGHHAFVTNLGKESLLTLWRFLLFSLVLHCSCYYLFISYPIREVELSARQTSSETIIEFFSFGLLKHKIRNTMMSFSLWQMFRAITEVEKNFKGHPKNFSPPVYKYQSGSTNKGLPQCIRDTLCFMWVNRRSVELLCNNTEQLHC